MIFNNLLFMIIYTLYIRCYLLFIIYYLCINKTNFNYFFYYFLIIILIFYFKLKMINGDWGLGIGDWGLGIGDWAQ